MQLKEKKKMNSRIEHISSEIIPMVIDIEDFTYLRDEPCGNYDEEKLLNTPEYRKKLADAIVSGIETYYERGTDNENICNR